MEEPLDKVIFIENIGDVHFFIENIPQDLKNDFTIRYRPPKIISKKNGSLVYFIMIKDGWKSRLNGFVPKHKISDVQYHKNMTEEDISYAEFKINKFYTKEIE